MMNVRGVSRCGGRHGGESVYWLSGRRFDLDYRLVSEVPWTRDKSRGNEPVIYEGLSFNEKYRTHRSARTM